MFPVECIFERRVRPDDDEDIAKTNLPLFILECKDRKAVGYAGDELAIYTQMLQRIDIGVSLADAPPAVSYLVILGFKEFAEIVAVDKTVIVIMARFPRNMPHLVYDAVALSLRLIPPPENPSCIYTRTFNISIARPCQGDDDDYAMVHTGMLTDVDKVGCLCLWRPSSSRPWSEKKESIFPELSVIESDTEFSFNGHAYWVDLLSGISYCRSDVLFDANIGNYIHLPVEPGSQHRENHRVAPPAAYRTIGVVRDSFIRFVSIDGFENHVKLKNRTVTVWKLPGHDQPWEEEHKLSLKTLWGFEGFAGVPKDLTPMYPVLSTKNTDVVYLLLGECMENLYRWKFMPTKARYLLAIDMRRKIVTSVATSAPLANTPFLSCDFSRYICADVVRLRHDEGNIASPPRSLGAVVAEAPIDHHEEEALAGEAYAPTWPSWETS